MNHKNFEEGFFKALDHTKLFYWRHRAVNPQATLILLHGHGEHSGRYRKFVSYLQKHSLDVVAYDFRGHGRSEGAPVFVKNYNVFIEDLSAFVHFLDLQEKFILFGHSNGGLAAVHWALKHQERLKGLVLSSPFLGLKLPGMLKALNRFMNRFLPGFIWKNPVYPPYLTHNEAELIEYKKDPYIRRRISVRLLDEMFGAISSIQALPETEWLFPIFILMAGQERVVDPLQTKCFFERAKAPDKDLHVFGGMYHEIFNELDQEKVFEKLSEYLERILRQ